MRIQSITSQMTSKRKNSPSFQAASREVVIKTAGATAQQVVESTIKVFASPKGELTPKIATHGFKSFKEEKGLDGLH